jgi:hypothetical protein
VAKHTHKILVAFEQGVRTVTTRHTQAVNMSGLCQGRISSQSYQSLVASWPAASLLRLQVPNRVHPTVDMTPACRISLCKPMHAVSTFQRSRK